MIYKRNALIVRSHNGNEPLNGFHKTAVSFQDSNKVILFVFMFDFFNNHAKSIVQRWPYAAIDEQTITFQFIGRFTV